MFRDLRFNPLATNGHFHPYHLDESTFIKGSSGASFRFYLIFRRNPCKQIEKPQMVTPRFAASHMGLFCLPMPHKKDDRLIWVKTIFWEIYFG